MVIWLNSYLVIFKHFLKEQNFKDIKGKRKDVVMKEIILTVVTQETEDDVTYPITKIFRYDFDGDENDIIKLIENHDRILEGGQLSND